MEKSIIAKREDGFVISYAWFEDFKNIKNLVKNLSKESKCLFSHWLFDEKPTFQARIGQIIAPLSLLPIIRPLAKKIFPMAYLVILQVKSPESKVVGFILLNHFQKISDGYFSAFLGTVVSDDYQGKGLATFLRNTMLEITKKEKLGILKSGVFLKNEKSLSFYKKNKFEVEKIEKNRLSCGKKLDMIFYKKYINDFQKTN